MNDKSADQALKFLYNLSSNDEEQVYEVLGTMQALCVWAQSHKATKSELLILTGKIWDSVDEFKNAMRLKKQIDDLGLKL